MVKCAVSSFFISWIGIHFYLTQIALCDLELLLARCCSHGANWAREQKLCDKFQASVSETNTEHKPMCFTTARICCTRFYRELECEKGKQASRAAVGCDPPIANVTGVQYYRDCCDGCSLGLLQGVSTASGSSSVGVEGRCYFKAFRLGPPWQQAFEECCLFATHLHTTGGGGQEVKHSSEFDGGYNEVLSDPSDVFSNIPDSENLCVRFPGQLCGHVCVPTKGSYTCQCRAGFTLSDDGKTCIQEHVHNRCEKDNPCDHVCQDTGISVECTCYHGYELQSDLRTCKDTDECASHLNQCVVGEQLCYNQVGSYSCMNPDGTFSTPGIRWNGTGIVPLTQPRGNLQLTQSRGNVPLTQSWGRGSLVQTRGSAGRLLTNDRLSNLIPDSHQSQVSPLEHDDTRCPLGYKYNLNSQVCDDIDECLVVFGICGEGLSCYNTIGSYSCSPLLLGDCPTGFRFNLNLQSCLDIDECLLGSSTCDPSTELCVNTHGSYKCKELGVPQCPPGYKFNTHAKSCEDINECNAEDPPCGERATCLNDIGSYRCISKDLECALGYRPDDSLTTCMDINECEEGFHLCDSATEECSNMPGGYRCDKTVKNDNQQNNIRTTTIKATSPSSSSTSTSITTTITSISSHEKPLDPQCPQGFAYNQLFKSCADVNECEFNPCPSNQLCSNTQGSFTCQCKDGFAPSQPEAADCVDINECQLGLHTCGNTQRCDNTFGSYSCVRLAGCGTGYTLNYHTNECEDDDECLLETHGCNQLGPKWTCVNTKGSFRCVRKTCPTGQVLDSWGVCINVSCTQGYTPEEGKCIDVNECLSTPSVCKSNKRCINLKGSFRCQPRINCGRGYHMNELGTNCVDIDECVSGLHECGGGQSCINRPGGYVCQCPPGFRFDATRHCKDVDECNNYFHNVCGSNSVCKNLPGSYECECNAGFNKSANGQTCEDMDECATSPNICDQKCINIWGSYQCACRTGFKLDDDKRSCNDIDECEAIKGRGRLCLGVCVNIPGSFKCSCPLGYRLDADQRTCKDINECDSLSTCDLNDICVNTRSDHRCEKLVCPENYTRDLEHKNRCTRKFPCWKKDTACRQQPHTYSFNFLPLASNMTLRPLGEVDLFTLRGPLWSSSNVQFELSLESTNVPPSVPKATRQHFVLKRTSFNQGVLTLVQPLIGPQEVKLILNMKLFHNGVYEGLAVAKLTIYVSQYDF